ncbi:c-type cytochrome biogenesis protein CcsB [Cellulomonas alba]|uniref:C-type cytochrome biogenesis protein CcsB n=1 Tax=Cellulomonas alba TaxID=3053467 RepID=A0ABT7SFV0_9CELL|nr:c-type cytochrome biogenesis protein CcsB [Cellulomonas alba]MDM7854417.1 c-type cytochrome biogenesis protein CcsB [Cellulomonas alba]
MSTGNLSTLLVWAAATAFTIALVAYAVDLARIADRAGRRSAVAAAGRAQVADDAAVADDRADVEAQDRVAVGAGVGASAAGAASGGARVAADVGARPGSPTTSAIAGSSAQAAAGRSAKAEGIARSTTYLGIALLLAGIVLRGVAAGRWPTANMYEFTLVGVFVATTALAIVQRRRVIAFLGVVVMAFAVLALVLALNKLYVQAEATQPALKSYWLVIHVGVAITATGIFTVGFAAAVLQVMRDARETGRSHLVTPWRSVDGLRRALTGWRITGRRFGWLDQVPTARDLEALSFRLNAVGFVLWTFTLIAGSIWAEHAWGRYWGWDPKEIGTFVAWVVYAAYLHARTTRGWTGRKAAYFVYVGYAVVLMNFTVINLVVTGKHSYSGI